MSESKAPRALIRRGWTFIFDIFDGSGVGDGGDGDDVLGCIKCRDMRNTVCPNVENSTSVTSVVYVEYWKFLYLHRGDPPWPWILPCGKPHIVHLCSIVGIGKLYTTLVLLLARVFGLLDIGVIHCVSKKHPRCF